MRREIQRRKYSPKTEKTYVYWVRRFILFHNKNHPKDMGPDHIAAYLTLRVQDLDLSLKTLTVRNTKGQQARVIMIPDRLIKPLHRHLMWRQQMHVNDLNKGAGDVVLPDALARKYKNAPTSFQWQYLFPSMSLHRPAKDQPLYRWHCSTSTLQKAVRKAAKEMHLNKRVTAAAWVSPGVVVSVNGQHAGNSNHLPHQIT